jgi:hypothetical protein
MSADPHGSRFAGIDRSSTLGRAPFEIGHGLERHPLFGLGRLRALALRLPGEHIEYHRGDLPVSQDPDKTPANGMSVQETISNLGEGNSWMALKHVQLDPEYRALLDRCLDQLAHQFGRRPEAFFQRRAFVFLSSPGSMTPFHIDPEENFLLQIRGWKQMHVFDPEDRELVGQAGLERFFAGGHRNLTFDPAWEPRARSIRIDPGQGLHVPQHAPHFVRNGDQVSISFSITFQTRESDRKRAVHRMNRTLRRLALSPRPPGGMPPVDASKYAAYRAMRRVRAALRGTASP